MVPSLLVGVKENFMEVAPAKPPSEARMLPVVIEPVRLALDPDSPEVTEAEDMSEVPSTVFFGVVVTDATISPFSSRFIVIVSFCKAVPKSDIFTICLPDG